MEYYIDDLIELEAQTRGKRLTDSHKAEAKPKPIENTVLHVETVESKPEPKPEPKPESKPEPEPEPKKKRKVPLREIKVMSKAEYLRQILKEFDH